MVTTTPPEFTVGLISLLLGRNEISGSKNRHYIEKMVLDFPYTVDDGKF